MHKVDSIQQQMDNVSGKMKILWKNPKDKLEIKNTVQK